MVDQSGAVALFNTNAFIGRNGFTPKFLILHGTAGGSSATAIGNYFLSTVGSSNPVSSHYIIGTDGTIVQAVKETDAAWANGVLTNGHDLWWSASINPNYITISIEHCKTSLDNSNALTAAQQTASFALVADICDRWGIPRRIAGSTGGITGHFSIDPISRKNCPGDYPWDELWAYLTPVKSTGLENSGMFTPTSSDFNTYWSVQGEHWTCKKNSYNIGGNIRQYYSDLSINGQTLPIPGLPQSNEIRVAGTINDTIQHFERMTLRYSPSSKSYPPGSEYSVYVLMTSDPLTQTK